MASLDYDTEKAAFREFYDGSRGLLEGAKGTFVTLIRSLLTSDAAIAGAKIEGRIKEREECLGKFRRKYQTVLEAEKRHYTTPDLAVARVGTRVEEGGHIVPENKIRARYERGAPFIRAAVLKANRGMVFDNSRLNQPPSHCLTFANGRLVFALPRLPDWIRSVYEADLEI